MLCFLFTSVLTFLLREKCLNNILGLYFPVFGLNTEIYIVQSKNADEKNPKL